MPEYLTTAFAASPQHLGIGWFWFLPLSFIVHDGEEAIYIWMMGSLKNDISSTSLSPAQAMIAMAYELAIIVVVTIWAARPDASSLAIFSYAVLLGLWIAHGFLHLGLQYRAGRHYSMGIVTVVPVVLLGGICMYALLLQTGMLTWGWALASLFIGILLILPFIRSARQVALAFRSLQ